MEMRRAFFAGWIGCGRCLWWMVDGGWRMPDAWETGAACSGLRRGLLLGSRILLKPFLKSPNSRLAAARQRTFSKQRSSRPDQLPSCRVVANRHPSPRLFGSGREVVVGVWGDWRKWGLMKLEFVDSRELDEPSALRWMAGRERADIEWGLACFGKSTDKSP